MATHNPIRVGVIGVGQIGKRHVEQYVKMNNVELVAIADVNEAEAQRVGAMMGVPHVYTDLHKLLARDDIQAVDVCLHNNYHMAATIAAFEAGKDVFCEKPMAGAYIDALKMWEASQATGRKFGIQFVTMYANEAKAAKSIIDSGQLGRIYHARSYGFRRRGRPYVDGYGTPNFVQKQHSAGGALYDMGVYHISTLLWLIGLPKVERITGKAYQEIEMDEKRRAASGYNVEELGVGFVRFEGGLSLDILEAWAVHMDKFDGSMILGNQAGLRLEPFGFYRSMGDLDLDCVANMAGFDWRIHNVREDGDAYDGPQQHWIAALQGRVPLMPTAAAALSTMLISEGIYLSDRLGREVTADEVRELSVSTALNV